MTISTVDITPLPEDRQNDYELEIIDNSSKYSVQVKEAELEMLGHMIDDAVSERPQTLEEVHASDYEGEA